MRRVAAITAVTASTLLAAAPPASAHGLVGRTDLPIPDWLFTWGAASVLVVSFLGLAVLWPRPRLQEARWRPLPGGLSRVLTSRALETVFGAIGVALLVLVVVCGLTGNQLVSRNIAPTFVYVGFWLGLVPLSVLFGDVFRLFNPWRAIGRAAGAVMRRIAPDVVESSLPYPERLGLWPAAGGLLLFGWLELVAVSGDEPRTVAIAALIYTALTLVAMALYGVEAWTSRGEAFSVYFGLFARLSPFSRRDGRLGVQPPLTRLPAWPAAPGVTALLAVMIGIVSFDGLSGSVEYTNLVLDLDNGLRDLTGISADRGAQVVQTLTLALMIAVVGGLYLFGAAGARRAGGRATTSDVARSFAHTLVPIALAYVAAHYVSLLVFQGQALASLASDPAGNGSDLLGTADWSINYTIIGAATFWYLQVAFVVGGHVAGLVLAHDRALAVFRNARAAVQSQYWLLGVMVAYTSLALFLLAMARGD